MFLMLIFAYDLLHSPSLSLDPFQDLSLALAFLSGSGQVGIFAAPPAHLTFSLFHTKECFISPSLFQILKRGGQEAGF